MEQAAKTSLALQANTYSTKETRIFTTEETQLNKGYSAKTSPQKRRMRPMTGSTARHASKRQGAPQKSEKNRGMFHVEHSSAPPTHHYTTPPYDPERATPSRTILLHHRQRDSRGATASTRPHPAIQRPTPRRARRSQRDHPLAPRYDGRALPLRTSRLL